MATQLEIGKVCEQFFDNTIKHGKNFGYHVKASKSQLIVKDEKYNEAMKERGQNIGSVIRCETDCKIFLETQLKEPNKKLKKKLARSRKHRHKTCTPVTQ